MPWFQWISDHIHILGWGTVITAMIKLFRWASKVSARAAKAEQVLLSLEDNHFKHIEASTERSAQHLEAMREDIKEVKGDLKSFLIAVLKK